jgi:hypothetical protein
MTTTAPAEKTLTDCQGCGIPVWVHVRELEQAVSVGSTIIATAPDAALCYVCRSSQVSPGQRS